MQLSTAASTCAARLATASLALALTLVALAASPVSAASDLYVAPAPAGSDSSDCLSPATPCATVGGALVKAAGADTIHVAAGAYSEQVVIDKAVTILGPNAGVDPNTATRGAEAVFSGAGPIFTLQNGTLGVSGVTIDGLAFANVTGTAYNGVITVPGYGAGNVTIADNTFTDVTAEAVGYHGNMGLVAPLGTNWTVEANRVERVTGLNRSGLWFGNLTGSVIRDNVVIDPARSGILVSGGTDVSVTGNQVLNAVFGLNIGTDAASSPITNVALESNTVLDSTFAGIVINSPTLAPGVTILFNRLTGNATGIYSNATTTVVAENQWWGCNAGPGAPGCDTLTGTIDADPWLTLTLTADPASVLTGGTAALHAALTANSAGATPSGGSIMDGTSIAFSVDTGTLSAPSAGTVDGVASVTLTAGTTRGTATAQAVLDHQTVSAAIVVTAPAPNATPTPTPSATLSPAPNATPTPTPSARAVPETSTADHGLDGRGGPDSAALFLAALALLGGVALWAARRRLAR